MTRLALFLKIKSSTSKSSFLNYGRRGLKTSSYFSLFQTENRHSFAPESSNEKEGLIVRSPYDDVSIPTDVSISDYIRGTMGKWGKLTAYECAVSGKSYTHDQVFEMSRSFGASLIQAGFKKGDVIAVVLQNVPEYASVICGIWEANLIATTVNPIYTVDEIKHQVNTVGAVCVVTSPIFLKTINSVRSVCPTIRSVIVLGDEARENCHSFNQMIKTDPNSVEFPKWNEINHMNDTTFLPFSSGTTGLPKGVCLTQNNLLSNLFQINIPEFRVRPRDITSTNFDQERILGLLPFFHVYGFSIFLNYARHMGAKILCLPKFEPELFLKSVRNFKPTTLYLVTPLIAHIANSPDYTKKELESVELYAAGAAPVGKSLIKRLKEKSRQDFAFREGYGMTELTTVAHLSPTKIVSGEVKYGSCGQLIPNSISKIVDISTGQTVGKNEKGEICVKGPNVMKGYYNNEEATRNTIDEEGWLHTGDVGYYDDDGYLWIVDRIKELIKVKGFQVAPSELEDLLRKHEGVSDVGVIGVPNEEWGEVPRAYIVPKTPHVRKEDVSEYLKGIVSSFKQLRGGIEFVKEIPKAQTGKILRRKLLIKYREDHGIPTS